MRNKHRPTTTTTTTPRRDAYRIRFITDPDAQFEESNGEPRPLTREEYAGNEYMHDGQPIPYTEYLNYYGNPDRHVYLMSEVQKQCRCCGTWTSQGGTGSIDVMDDSPDLAHMDHWFTPETLYQLGESYLYFIAIDDLAETGWTIPKHVHCRHRGCRFYHVFGSPYCTQHQPGQREVPADAPRT